ncbi:MAG: VWA domain-containing protein, partial [Pseudomonadota bacterium]
MTETLANFHFLRPLALLMWLPVIALGVLLWRHRNRTETWSQVIAPELLPYLLTGSPQKRSRSARPILIVAWCLATIGAAGPSWEQLPKPVLQKQDAMILLMDLSLSMLATDLAPSRADRVRRKLLDLLRERDEGLTALVAYAGDAHVVAPLTDDNPTIANLLPALNPTMMPLPGSDPVDAVRRAVELLDSAGVRRARLLLVTDGVTQGDVDGIADLLRNRPVQLMVMGVGTRSGAPIGLPEGGFLKNESGDIVVPKLEESVLRQLAAETSGQYRTMSVDDSDLELLLDTPFSMSDEDTIDLDRRADQWQDAAHWFVLPLLLVSLVSFRRGMVAALLVGILLPNQEAEAFEWQDLWLNADQQGKAALDAGDAEAAANLFTQNDWRAKAQFEAGDYETAGKTFGETATADGWYNRGNALAAQGELDKAITAYKKSLALQPESEDAQKNIETLEKLKEEQQQQQQQG